MFHPPREPPLRHWIMSLLVFAQHPHSPPHTPPGPWSKMAKTRNLIAWDSWTRVNHLIVVLCMLCRRSTKGWAKKRDVVGIDFGWTRRWQLANKFQGADKVDRRGLDDEGLTSSPPGILLALENIRWLVSFIPRQNISGAIPQIRLLLNSENWSQTFYGFVFLFASFIVRAG